MRRMLKPAMPTIHKGMSWEKGYSVQGDKFDLMQFTGLKDKNGKEIYEGDLIKDSDGIARVEYFSCSFGFEDRCEELWHLIMENGEVIGNIYEHSHLLEGSNA